MKMPKRKILQPEFVIKHNKRTSGIEDNTIQSWIGDTQPSLPSLDNDTPSLRGSTSTSLPMIGAAIRNALNVLWGIEEYDAILSSRQEAISELVTKSTRDDFGSYKSKLTHADREPYFENEKKFRDLFENKRIEKLDEQSKIYFSDVEDVDQDETKVINVAREKCKIGTVGLRTCIAICGYGKTKNNEAVLGLSHYSSLFEPDVAFKEINNQMKAAGAKNIEYYLVGGVMTPGGHESMAMQTESKLLALKDKYNILGVRLHLSEDLEDTSSESDVESHSDSTSDDETSYDVVMTSEKIFFRKKSMY
jgi:hypothetical protein